MSLDGLDVGVVPCCNLRVKGPLVAGDDNGDDGAAVFLWKNESRVDVT